MSLMSSAISMVDSNESSRVHISVPKLKENNYTQWKCDMHSAMLKVNLDAVYKYEIKDYISIKMKIDRAMVPIPEGEVPYPNSSSWW